MDGKEYSSPCYPSVAGTYGNNWVTALLDMAVSEPEANYDRVEFSYLSRIPVEEESKSDILLRCDPDYHSYPWERRSWHDWVMVNWSTPTREYQHAAKLLLFAKYIDTETGQSELRCAIQSLQSSNPCPDNVLPFFVGDHIDRAVRVIPASMIASVAYVLPTVANPGDRFPKSVDDASYFVVVPPRPEWKEIGERLIDEFDLSEV